MKNRHFGNRTTDLLLAGLVIFMIGFIPVYLCLAGLKANQAGLGELFVCGIYGFLSFPFLALGGGLVIAALVRWLLLKVLK